MVVSFAYSLVGVISFVSYLVGVVSFAYSLVRVVSFAYSLVGVISFAYSFVSFVGLKISLSYRKKLVPIKVFSKGISYRHEEIYLTFFLSSSIIWTTLALSWRYIWFNFFTRFKILQQSVELLQSAYEREQQLASHLEV